MTVHTVNPRKVVHQTIDGETIIIQFDTGIYYSLLGAGADIWQLLAAGRSRDEIVAGLARTYDADPQELGDAVARLVAELEREDLIEQVAETAGKASANGASPPAPAARRPFEPPVLEKYTDMQDFLLVDPIHEVDDAGWPSVRAEG